MKDPYQVLGVAKTASADEIKQAYRGLARKLHPDLNPGDRKAEERFKEISAAYDFLSDAGRRAQYDRGEIDPTGAAKRRGWRPSGAGAKASRSSSSSSGGFGFGDDVEDILAELFRRKEKGKAQWSGGPKPGERTYDDGSTGARGGEARHGLSVTFAEAAAGTTKRVTLVTGKSLDMRIPPGTTDGQTLRLKGQGYPGFNGGEPGDAFIEIKVQPHPLFSRRELDVLLDLPVSIQEAVMGAKITVPTIDGKVALTIPPGSNSGTTLRLKGKGIASGSGRGDQLVTLRVVLPENDAEFQKFVDKWGPRHGYDPRAKSGLV